MRIPTLEQAELLLSEAETRNPGPWVPHSRNTALAARILAGTHPDLAPEPAYILGLLHDIGRGAGVTGMRHVYDGFLFLSEKGFDDAARICLTHSFPIPNVHAGSSEWDCTPEELSAIQNFLESRPYDAYDRLFQLCDSLALPDGFCTLENRWIDVLMRYGNFGKFTIPKWQAIYDIKGEFDRLAGGSIYRLLPGLAERVLG